MSNEQLDQRGWLISTGSIPRPLGRVFCRVEKAQRFHLAGGYTPSAFYPPYQYPVACGGVVYLKMLP